MIYVTFIWLSFQLPSHDVIGSQFIEVYFILYCNRVNSLVLNLLKDTCFIILILIWMLCLFSIYSKLFNNAIKNDDADI